MMIRKILFVFMLQYTCAFLSAQKVHDYVRLSELILSDGYSESLVTLNSDYCIARIEEGDNTVCLLLSKTKDERYEVVLRKDFICEIENTNQYIFYTENGENVLFDIFKNKEIKFQQDFDNIVYLCSTNEGDYFFTGDIIRSDGWTLPLRDGCEVSSDKDKVILSYGINKFDINTILRKATIPNHNNHIKVFYKTYREDLDSVEEMGYRVNASNFDGDSPYNIFARQLLSEKLHNSITTLTGDAEFSSIHLPVENISTKDLCNYYGRLFVRKYNDVSPITEEYSQRLGMKVVFEKQFESDSTLTIFYKNYLDYGGMHGFITEEYISMNKSTGKIVTFDNSIKKDRMPEFRKTLFRMMKKEYERKNGISISDEDYTNHLSLFKNIGFGATLTKEMRDSDLVFDATDFTIPNFGLTQEGCVVCFQPYMIDSFAMGVYSIIIPYDEISQYLVHDFGKVKSLLSIEDLIDIDDHDICQDSTIQSYYKYILQGNNSKARQMIYNRIKRSEDTITEDVFLEMLFDAIYLYRMNEDYVTSNNCAEFAASLASRLLGEDHSLTKVINSELAQSYELLGRFEDSYKILQFLCHNNIEENLFYLDVVQKLAELSHIKEDYVNSAQYYSKVFDLCKRLDANNIISIEALMNSAIDWCRAGNYQKSHDLFISAANLTKYQLLTDDTQDGSGGINKMKLKDLLLKIYFNMSIELKQQKRYYEALKALDEADKVDGVWKDVNGSALIIGQERILLNWQMGKCDAKEIRVVTEKTIEFLKEKMIRLTWNERISFWNNWKAWFEVSLPQIILSNPNHQLNEVMYDAILFSKGIMLASNRTLNDIILNSQNEELTTLYSLYLEKIKELNIIQPTEESEYDEMKADVSRVERKMMSKSLEYKNFMDELSINADQIRKVLDNESVAIEFINFQTADDKDSYYALLVSNNFDTPISVPIVSCSNSQGNADSLFQNIWETLSPHLKNKSKVYFAPSGLLYNVPIESNAFLYNQNEGMNPLKVFRLSSTREIINNKKKTGNICAIYGGLKYDDRTGYLKEEREKKCEIKKFSNRRTIRSNNGTRMAVESLDSLPATLKEVDEIEKIIKHSKNDLIVKKFSGCNGTEISFKSLGGKNLGVIHIATHGFYHDKESISKTRCTYLQEIYSNYDPEDKTLSYSGLFLSGSADAYEGISIPNDSEDGILTAQEISSLDFRTVDLVTISACDSGKGEISGDGVFGLQRGFKKAGVQSILMSLWKVDDEATCLLMTEFYKNWISRGKSKHEALEMAKQTVRSYNDKGWNAPNYWTAFILLDALD